MALTDISLPSGTVVSSLTGEKAIAMLNVDDVYIGAGSLSASELTAATANKTTLAALVDNMQILGIVAAKPTKIDDEPETFEVRSGILQGRPATTIEVRLAGITNGMKNWLQSGIANKSDHTIVLTSRDFSQAIIYNGCRWTYKRTAESQVEITLTTKIMGITATKELYYDAIPDATTP